MSSEQSMVGRTISNKYRIISHIGSGAMGSVFLAEHTSIQKRVALKILHADLNVNDDILRRFQQEGIAAGKFNHPNAIQIFDFDKDGEDIFYLAMEYVEGTSLKKLLEEKGAQPVPKAIHITRQVLGALSEAHKQGIIHRDLKPENIMISDPGTDEPGVKILDFGISKLMDFSGEQGFHTQTGRIMGTPYYMAPEQFSGETVDHRSDIFATGLVLFELLAGKRPFQGETVSEILFKHAIEETPPVQALNPEQALPKGLNDIVARATQKKPADRYQSAQDMVRDLEGIDLGKIETKVKPGTTTSLPAPSTRSSSVLPKVLLGAGALAILVGLVIYLPPLFKNMGSGDSAVRRVSMKDRSLLTDLERTYVDLLSEARTKMAMGNTLEAINAANLALRMDCKDSEGYLVRGRAYLQKRDLDTARPDFEEALKLDPDYAEAVSGLGSVHLERGDLDPAMARFEQATELDPSLGAAVAGQGIVHYQKGEVESAREKMTQAIALDPENSLAHLYLGRIQLEEGKVDEAGDSFIQAKRNDATLWEAYYWMGQVYEARGKLAEAEQQYRDASKLNPDATRAENALCAILLSQDRIADAQSLADRTLKRHPDSARTHVLQGILHFRAGRKNPAIESLERGFALEYDDARARALLGALYQDQGRYREALGEYRRSVQSVPDQPATYQNIGVCMMKLERYEEARDALDKSIMLDDTRPYPHYALGLLYMDFLEEEDSAEQAAAAFTEYRRLGGDDPRVPDWISELQQ